MALIIFLITTLHGPNRKYRFQLFVYFYGLFPSESPDVVDVFAGRYQATAVVPAQQPIYMPQYKEEWGSSSIYSYPQH
jgi:hypothetical protein